MKRSWKVNLGLLVSGQMVSVFGSSLHLVVVILFLKELTGQAFSLGLFQFTAYLPIVLLAPAAGIAVDTMDPKRILIAADMVRGIVMLLLGLLLFRDMLGYEALLIGTFCISIGPAFFQPAVHAVFPSIVAPPEIEKSNGIRSAGLLGANFAGTGLGGLAFALIGPAAIFLFNGGSFLLSALEETFIRLPRRSGNANGCGNETGRGNRKGHRNEIGHGLISVRLRETLSYLKEDRGALSAILSYGLIQSLYPPVVIALPFFLDEVLALGAAAYGYAMALLLAGGGAGALLYGFIIKNRKRNRGLFFGALILLSLLLIVVGLHPRTWLLFSALPLAGISLGTVHQIMTSSLYHGIRTDSRGRVFGIMESLASAALPVSYGISGIAVGLFRGHLTAFFPAVGIISALAAVFLFLRGRLGPFISGKA